jgi:hypothetical protein
LVGSSTAAESARLVILRVRTATEPTATTIPTETLLEKTDRGLRMAYPSDDEEPP